MCFTSQGKADLLVYHISRLFYYIYIYVCVCVCVCSIIIIYGVGTFILKLYNPQPDTFLLVIFHSGSFFNDALMTFVVGHWSVSRQVTDRYFAYGGDNLILLDQSSRTAAGDLPLEAFSWLVKHMSREGDTVADPNSNGGGGLVAALRQGRNALWLSTAAQDAQPQLLRRLAQQLCTTEDVPSDTGS